MGLSPYLDIFIFITVFYTRSELLFLMSLKKHIGHAFRHTRAFLRLERSQRSQTYDVLFEVKLHNSSFENKSFFLIIPEPYSHEHQILQSDITYAPEEAISETDRLFGNNYAAFKVSLKAEASEIFTQRFSVTTFPTRPKIDSTFVLEDYKNMDETVRPLALKFSAPNRFVNGRDKEIQSMANDILKSVPSRNLPIIMRKVNNFVRDYLEYKNPIPGLYTYEEALHKKAVDCGGFDVFFISLCHALGIPARIVSGFYAGYTNNTMHAWAEFMQPNGVWVPVDPSTEQLFLAGRTKKLGTFGFCPSDQIIFSTGCDIPLSFPAWDEARLLQTEHFTDILQNPFIYPEKSPIVLESRIITSLPSKIT